MNTKSITRLLSTTTLALCSLLLSAPYATAAENKNVNAADEKFIQDSAADDMATLKLGELGVKKAIHPDIKAYAAMIVADHTKSYRILIELAATNGVNLSGEIEPARTKAYQKVDESSGTEFDREFLALMVNDHKMCVRNYEKASEEAEDPEVNAFATERLPTLRAHLDTATELSLVGTEPDNTVRNVRDRDGKDLTPFDQGSSQSDTEITAAIRKEILDAKDLSVNAQNVKIITLNGKVTLRGPVNTAGEKQLITEIARRIAHSHNVDSQLEVK